MGRTGVFLAIDTILDKLEKGVINSIDVFGQVSSMRERRMYMVQTLVWILILTFSSLLFFHSYLAMLFLKWKNPGNVVSSPFFPKARKPRTITIIALAVLRRGCFLLFVTNFVNRNIISKLINIDVLEQKLVNLCIMFLSGAIYICTRSYFGKHPLWHKRSAFYWNPERNWNSRGA